MNKLFNPRPRSEYIAPHTTEAAQFVEAIRTIAAKPDNLDNLESYLSHHFSEWLQKWANTPENIVSELRNFAETEI